MSSWGRPCVDLGVALWCPWDPVGALGGVLSNPLEMPARSSVYQGHIWGRIGPHGVAFGCLGFTFVFLLISDRSESLDFFVCFYCAFNLPHGVVEAAWASVVDLGVESF